MIGDGDLPMDWNQQLNLLIDLAGKGDRTGVIRQLKALVKGYTPQYRFHGIEFPDEDISVPPVLSAPPSKSLH
jgi:hypothetical protein